MISKIKGNDKVTELAKIKFIFEKLVEIDQMNVIIQRCN